MRAMSIRTSPWPTGVPCWVDLGTPDVAAAQRRYGPAFGWEFEDSSDEYGGYVMARRRGAHAAGLGPLQPGNPPAWTLYLSAEDADATARAVEQAGGSVLAAPFDVGDAGRMGIVQDPTGAVFGLWQAKGHVGAGLVNEPGGLVWEDHNSAEPDRARQFYREVFGFRYDDLPADGMEGYTTFALEDGVPLGGIGPAQGEAPSHWMPCFAVEDTDRSAALIAADGGRPLVPPTDTPYGRLAVVADPDGAMVAVMQTSGEDAPDRAG
jgi:uncharacterized protein